jgi:DNA repair protein RecN (Recombination protein N)
MNAAMLIGLSIKDVVLIEALNLDVGAGLTALTGETGAGKSIVLDALGLALGRRADAGLVRRGASQAMASAVFALPSGHPAFAYLEARGLPADPGEELVLRRQVSADGRSRAFVNDAPASVGVLRDLGVMLVEVHGQHETVGLLDPRTHRGLLDAYAGDAELLSAVAEAWAALRTAEDAAASLRDRAGRADEEREEAAARLAELDRLDPRVGEEASLSEARALLGAAEKALADIATARDGLGGDAATGRLASAVRALERARDRAIATGAAAENRVVRRLAAAAEAADRALVELTEAQAAVDSAAEAFEVEPDKLDKTEERLFALRAAARRLNVTVDELPAARARFGKALRAAETLSADIEAADRAARAAGANHAAAAARLTAARRAAGDALAEAAMGEFGPLKLDRARFRVAVAPADRPGAQGADRVAFEIATNPGAPFGPLSEIASGGELARFALALKVVLARRGDAFGGRGGGGGFGPTMVFDEVDQGVGGAVADAVGQRLKQLAAAGQAILVTHSPQVAARADAHWRVSKNARGEVVATSIETLDPAAREEEIARMLAGAEITEAARAAARALIGV